MLGIDLEKAIDFKVYLPSLETWFWGEMRESARVLPPPANPLAPTKVLMGCPLWGDEYIARFSTLCLPTLMAEKNRAALTGRCQIVFFTDEKSFKGLNYLARDMTNSGLLTTVHEIPQHIMDFNNGIEYEKAHQAHKKLVARNAPAAEIVEADRHAQAVGSTLNKYWLLGVTQQLLVWMAGKQGMGIHSLFPDHLYAEAYFENMWRLVEENHRKVAAEREAAGLPPDHAAGSMGIAQTGISGDIHACLPEIETFRQPDGSLVIPDRELGDIGWRHLHKQMKGNIMGKADLATDMPNSHYMFWVGKDKLHVNCCHMNAVWIPPSKTATSPIKLYNALDTMLPVFMPERVYIPDALDGLGFLEVSDDLKNESAPRVDFATYAAQAWNQVHLSDDWNPFFEASCEVPIKDQVEYTEEEEIKKQHATVCAWLKAAKPHVTEMLQAAQKKQEDLIAARTQAAPSVKSKRALKRQAQAKRRHNGAEHHAGAD